MADLATPVPGQPDSPYFWAKGTSEPKPNLSGEILAKGAASAIHEGVQGVNAAYEKGIQNTIYNAVDPLRDQYMERLHSADQTLQGRETPDPLGRDAPRDVKGLPGSLNTLDSARANGKLSQTDYDARLTALAKEIRGKYPGYREYVDETFKRITGRDSANQYIKSVIGDIDSYMSSRKGEGEKLANKILGEGMNYAGAATWYQKVQSNPDKYGPSALQWLNDMKSKDHALEMSTKVLDFEKAANTLNREKEADITNKGVTESGAHYYSAALDTIATHMDIDPKTNDRMQDIMNKMRRGESIRDVKPEEAVQLRTFLEQQKAGLSANRAADLSHAFPNMKTEEISKVIQDEFKTQYDPYMEALGKGDFDTANLLKNTIKARNLQAGSAAYNDPKWGHALSWLSGLREIDPQMANVVGMQIEQQAGMEMSGEFAKNATAAAAAPDKGGGQSFAKIADDMHAKSIKDGRIWKSQVELYSSIATKGPQAISNDAADKLIDSAFGPDNANVLANFAKEGTGRGKNLGQEYVYNTFTSEGMIDRIAKRAKEHPELYENYRNWVGSNIRYLLADHSTLTAVAPEPREGYEVVTPSSIARGARYGENLSLGQKSEVKAHYNDESNTFSFDTKQGPTNRPDLTSLANTLKRAAEVTKGDPNHQMDPTVAVYQMLKSMNAPEGSLVDQMLEAMRTARNKE